MAQLKARRVKKTYLALVAGQRGGGRRPDRGADRARPEAPDADGGRARRPAVGDRLPRPRAVRPAGRCSSSTSSPAGPTRSGSISTPSATRSPAIRSTARARRGAGRTGLDRLFLHAWRLELTSPSDGHLIRATAPLPAGARGGPRRRFARGAGPLTGDDRRRRGRHARRPGGRRATGADARHHLGAERRRQGHDHRCAARAGTHDPEYHYVVTCTTRAHAPGRGRRRRLPLPRPRDVPAHARRRRLPRGQRGPRQLVRHAARQVRERWPRASDVILKIDVQGAQVVKEQVAEALLIFVIPPSLEDAVPAAAQPRDRDGRRARAPPAQRGHRAGPPGGLRLRRRQRDRPGRADRRADRRRSSPTSIGAHPDRRVARLRPVALTRADARGSTPAHADGRRGGRGSSRSPSMRPGAAAPGPTRTSSRTASPISSRARRSWSSSAGARRSGSSLARGGAAPAGVAPKPIVDRVRADGPLLPPLGLALARWIAAHYLAPPALVLRAMLPPGLLERLELVAELRRRATVASATAPSARCDARPARPARRAGRGRSATSPRPEGRAGLLRRLRALGGPRRRSRSTGRCSARRPGRATSAGSG